MVELARQAIAWKRDRASLMIPAIVSPQEDADERASIP